ncbi:MAG: hypothetical protein KU37_06640 [Sulfuricurvum sp. PC08-66]|nr:MAG: hypothetical protein KU37_06640 [Sulfuricurvum sp. PC08-66]
MILLGHNGAGKSTLLSYLLGFYTLDKHHPFIAHFRTFIAPLHNSSIGYAPEAALLDMSLCARDYFAMMAGVKGIESYDRGALLAQVHLSVDERMALKHYSKGMKQRLLLALALLGAPQILVLDEPTSGLDPFGQARIEELLVGLKNSHQFILSTHSLSLAYRMEDEIWILKEGRIVYQGRPESLEALQTLFYSHLPSVLQ